MQLIIKFNEIICFLLCVIDIFCKYAWVAPLKDWKGITITNAFQKMTKRNPNKISVGKGSEFYNNSVKSWLQDNNIGTYSIHNEGKSVLTKRFVRTFKTKIYKYMTSNAYIKKLDEIANKYKNTYYRTIKMKPVDIKDNTYIDFGKESNNKDPKIKVGNHVRISKNIFAKGYTPNWSEEVFIIKKVKNTVPWTYVISDLNGEEIVEKFSETEFQKTNQGEFRIEKVIKRKGDKLCVKWKGYEN